jgi:protein gp37
MGQCRYRNGFQLTLHHDLIKQPLRWSRPRMVFVNSMSDLFHDGVPLEFIREILDVMAQSSHHIFQILTKRSERLRDLSKFLTWPGNVWMGVSVENDTTLYRIDDLLQVPCGVRFLSCEPLLGPLNPLHLRGIQWVIVGGESGPGARPMRAEWVDKILMQCENQHVPFFFKQWGGIRKNLRGRLLHGRLYDDLPKAAFAHPSASAAASFAIK